MLIDFHTHIFPDRIAERTIATLQKGVAIVAGRPEEEGIGMMPACSDGMLTGLRELMKVSCIDKCVVLPIATKEEQTENINNFAKEIDSEDVISLGSLYPYQKDWEQVMEHIAEIGLKGIKLHPEYQQFYINEKESIQILKKAEELGLLVVLHTGDDIGVAGPVHCTPKQLRETLDYVDGSRIIAAHLGGYDMWDDVEEYLVGTNIILDTAYLTRDINQEQYKRIIRNHGANKVVFGSDTPWENPQDTLALIKSLGLTDEEVDLITYKNAVKLLGV